MTGEGASFGDTGGPTRRRLRPAAHCPRRFIRENRFIAKDGGRGPRKSARRFRAAAVAQPSGSRAIRPELRSLMALAADFENALIAGF